MLPTSRMVGVQNMNGISKSLFLSSPTTRAMQRKALHGLFITLCVSVVIIFAVLAVLESPYLGWDFSDPETAVMGTVVHAFEWLFVRLAPFILIGSVVGIFLTRNKD